MENQMKRELLKAREATINAFNEANNAAWKADKEKQAKIEKAKELILQAKKLLEEAMN